MVSRFLKKIRQYFKRKVPIEVIEKADAVEDVIVSLVNLNNQVREASDKLMVLEEETMRAIAVICANPAVSEKIQLKVEQTHRGSPTVQ